METHLTPTNGAQWEALVLKAPDFSWARCVECDQEAGIAHFIEHTDGCIAAGFIKQAIANLPPIEQLKRREFEHTIRNGG